MYGYICTPAQANKKKSITGIEWECFKGALMENWEAVGCTGVWFMTIFHRIEWDIFWGVMESKSVYKNALRWCFWRMVEIWIIGLQSNWYKKEGSTTLHGLWLLWFGYGSKLICATGPVRLIYRYCFWIGSSSLVACCGMISIEKASKLDATPLYLRMRDDDVSWLRFQHHL